MYRMSLLRSRTRASGRASFVFDRFFEKCVNSFWNCSSCSRGFLIKGTVPDWAEGHWIKKFMFLFSFKGFHNFTFWIFQSSICGDRRVGRSLVISCNVSLVAHGKLKQTKGGRTRSICIACRYYGVARVQAGAHFSSLILFSEISWFILKLFVVQSRILHQGHGAGLGRRPLDQKVYVFVFVERFP